MKTNFLTLFLIVSLMPAVQSAYAQLSFVNGKMVKAAENVSKGAKRVPGVKVPSVKLPKVKGFSSSVSVPHVSSRSALNLPAVPEPTVALRLEELERSVRQLQTENRVLKAALNHITPRTALLRATFQATETTAEATNPFSGTVFKAVYNGEEEIFGVVAAHTIARTAGDKALKRQFTASIFDGENVVEVPAEIVQLSSPSMLDVALVKFAPEAESLFHPLRISQVPVEFGDMLSSQGFAGATDVNIPGRYAVEVTPLSIRTKMPYARDDRPGLCGSAVVNADQELVGIHTGSKWGRDVTDDVGFATNASFLNTLVEAYHNGGKASFPLILNKQKVADLNVDEYISYVSFLDEAGVVRWQKGFESKFSFKDVQEMLEIFNPRYLVITTRRAVWDESAPDILFENHTAPWDRSKTTYKYDWQERKLISKTQPKKK